MVKKNKTLDAKTASLWLQNTGQDLSREDSTETVTEEDTEQVTDMNDNPNIKKENQTNNKNPLEDGNKEKLTERFELKMSPLQMKKLEELADKYDKHKSEVMRTAFEFFINQL
ncbi:MAG: hypothetical protein ACOCRX_12295 [Candidatus Woesearchaeota archaeon]